MLIYKRSGLAIFVGVCLLGEASSSAHAQCVQPLTESVTCATEWSNGKITDLGGLPGWKDSSALSINDFGQVFGLSSVGGVSYVTEWRGGAVINLGACPEI